MASASAWRLPPIFEDGRIKNVYLEGEYGGFAIHIMQK